MTATKPKLDYPEERPDWLMVEEYARQRSIYGCILCDKTHKKEDCEHKAKRTVYRSVRREETQSWYD